MQHTAGKYIERPIEQVTNDNLIQFNQNQINNYINY